MKSFLQNRTAALYSDQTLTPSRLHHRVCRLQPHAIRECVCSARSGRLQQSTTQTQRPPPSSTTINIICICSYHRILLLLLLLLLLLGNSTIRWSQLPCSNRCGYWRHGAACHQRAQHCSTFLFSKTKPQTPYSLAHPCSQQRRLRQHATWCPSPSLVLYPAISPPRSKRASLALAAAIRFLPVGRPP